MNRNVENLYKIAQKKERSIIGLMSGTSLDGLDIALCKVKGSGMNTSIEVPHFVTVSYTDDFKNKIRSIFSKKQVDLELVCLLNPWVAVQHGQMILNALNNWGVNATEIDVIASHGQTIYHAPKMLHGIKAYSNATLQIGDGDHLAVTTGIITLSDFRQKHIAAGGEGAPLAVYGDYFLFSKLGENRIMLNIGGIANYTYLSGDLDASKIFSTDTGPGNTLMDAFVQQHFNKAYDEGGEIAKQGVVNNDLLVALKYHYFFEQKFPKTTGPELFNLAYLNNAIAQSGTKSISLFDTMATLNRFSADTIADALKKSINNSDEFVIYSSGGGMHNPLLMNRIKELIPQTKFYTTNDLQINPDAKEAVLFAILANECIAGGHTSIGGNQKDIPTVTMGKISFPN